MKSCELKRVCANIKIGRKIISKNLRINEQIKISPIRLIDFDGKQIGITETQEALKRARDYGLDLVEISPFTKPPVCKIMDYGKYKYEQNKKIQKQQKRVKIGEIKGVRISPRINVHDLEVKIKQARQHLEKKNKLKVMLVFKGREFSHQDLGKALLLQFASKLADIAQIEQEPKVTERYTMTILLAPKK